MARERAAHRFEVWLAIGSLPAEHRVRGVAREGNATLEVALPSSRPSSASNKETRVAKVMIGVDPHKRLNAVVVLNARGKVLSRRQFPNTAEGFRELRAFGRTWRPRTWAIEGCNGVGKHVAQRLVAGGERVVDVSTRRAALVRVFGGGNGRKNDDTDAHSIALVGLHTPDLAEVRVDDRQVALRLLSNRRKACSAGTSSSKISLPATSHLSRRASRTHRRRSRPTAPTSRSTRMPPWSRVTRTTFTTST